MRSAASALVRVVRRDRVVHGGTSLQRSSAAITHQQACKACLAATSPLLCGFIPNARQSARVSSASPPDPLPPTKAKDRSDDWIPRGGQTGSGGAKPPRTHRPAEGRAPRSTREEPYAFPVARALRYVRLGRHFYRRHDGVAEREALIQKAYGSLHDEQSPPPSPEGEDEDEGRNAPVLLSDGSAHNFCALRGGGSGAGNEMRDTREREPSWEEKELLSREEEEAQPEPPQLDEVRRFTNYHCHHVKVTFKATRTALTKKQRTAVPRRDPRAPPALLSVTETNQLLALLFQASVLLHITALFGVSEQYLESLLELCLSCTVFLSQQHNAWRHVHAMDASSRHRGGRGPQQHDRVLLSARAARRTPPPLAIPEAYARRNQRSDQEGARHAQGGERAGSPEAHLNALHWATVHFAEGVRLWGLLDHSELLFPSLQQQQQQQQQTEGQPLNIAVQTKLLQAYAGLLLSQISSSPFAASLPLDDGRAGGYGDGAPDHSTSVHHREDQHYLHSLLGGAQAQRATGALHRWFGLSNGNSKQDNLLSVQRRCMVLLPLLWLTMLSHHLHLAASSADEIHKSTHRNEKDLLGEDKRSEVTIRAARHGFLRVIPLLSSTDHSSEGHSHPHYHPVDSDRTVQVLLSLLYQPASTAHAEMATLLSSLEHAKSPRMYHAGTMAWLSQWRLQAQKARSEGGTVGSAYTEPVIDSPHQLYAALQHIPLICCGSPLLEEAASTYAEGTSAEGKVQLSDEDLVSRYFGDAARGASPGGTPAEQQRSDASSRRAARHLGEVLLQTKQGLLFANELLFRTLLQWRAAQLPNFIRSDDEGDLFAPPEVPDAADKSKAGEGEGEAEVAAETPVSAERRRLLSYANYMDELYMVLATAVHLREVHERLRATSTCRIAVPEAGFKDNAKRRIVKGQQAVTDLAAAVQNSTEAAMRALADQLGDSVLPARLQGLAWERRQAEKQRCPSDGGGTKDLLGRDEESSRKELVSLLEQRLLCAIHSVMMEVLVGISVKNTTSTAVLRATHDAMPSVEGRVPSRYLKGIVQLLQASAAP